jgi:DNA-binding winged helix-turn-helix (wHTH) protein
VRLRFTPFTVDDGTRQLLRDGAAVHLSPKAFDLLWYLAAAQPRVVEKTELQAKLWPETFVVDANLNVLVGEIRRALGDAAREPRYIRTVHGVGFAFCGGAVEVGAADDRSAARSACSLVTTEGTFRLAEGENIVGRDSECSVRLDSDSVSRRHARLDVDNQSRIVWLEDLGSKNGTELRREPVRGRVEVNDGDALVFGDVRATLRSWGASAAAETRRIAKAKRQAPK